MAPAGENPVVHLELHTPDLARARAFYTRLFEWRAETVRVGSGAYLALELGTGIEGGMVESARESPIWLPYVEVADIADATEAARMLGASVALKPREGPVGWRSVIEAPGGAEVALWQSK